MAAWAVVIAITAFCRDTETKLTDEPTRAIIISLTDRGWGWDARSCDTRLEGTTLSVITTAVRYLTDVIDADGAWDKAVAIVSTEEARDTAPRRAGLLGATVLITLTRGRHT